MSTYTCESTFSTIKIVKRKQRNELANAHLDCLTRIAVTNYKYFMRIVKQQLALSKFGLYFAINNKMYRLISPCLIFLVYYIALAAAQLR